ncbi:MAG: LysE family translocator [Candidatus Puniceispirillaceae bacterium]
MDWSTIISLTVFAHVAAFTPGPNNVMLAASGANYGMRATYAHIAGVNIGFLSLVTAAGLGLSGLFLAIPQLYDIMRVASFGFLIYLAWKIANAGPIEDAKKTKPLSFQASFAFQWINPKAVTVTISTITAYTSGLDSVYQSLAIILIVFGIATFGSTIAWTYAGQVIGRFLKEDRTRRLFNRLMAALLVICLLPVIISI